MTEPVPYRTEERSITMSKRLPKLHSDAQAEAFVAEANLADNQ
jgi:hypothetical protein